MIKVKPLATRETEKYDCYTVLLCEMIYLYKNIEIFFSKHRTNCATMVNKLLRRTDADSG